MRHSFILVSTTILGLTACANTADGESKPRGIAVYADDPRLGEKTDKVCFTRNVDGFRTASKDTVILSAGVNKDYLVSIRGACRNLRDAQSIAIDSAVSCVSKNDVLIVSESVFSLDDGTGFGPDRCFIDEIYKWDKRVKVNIPNG